MSPQDLRARRAPARAFLLALLAVAPALSRAATPDHPNILLICIDDLRPVLGCYGGAAKTPHMDKFAGESVVFRRHYVQFPSCGPSRASMLGGRRPDSLGVYGNSGTDIVAQDPEHMPTLPMLFKRNGYTTLSFGKVYHSKGASPGCGWSEPPWHPPNWACYVNFKERERKKKEGWEWRPAMEIYDGPDSLHGDYQTADRVIAALEAHRDGPFFIAAGFYKPHLPFVAPKRFWDLYGPDEIRAVEPVRRAEGAADYGYAFREICSYGDNCGKMFTPDAMPTARQTLDLIHAYHAATSFTDSHVGRLLSKIDELGLRENTAVVLWSDHGFHLGDQARWAKWTQFEADMRSPLVIRLPGKSAPARGTDALVESVDIYPTITSIAGLAAPPHLEGISLLPLIRGEVDQVKQFARSQVAGLQANGHLMAYSLRTPGYRYVEWRDRMRQNQLVCRELYDLASVGHELKNLAEDPGQEMIVEQHHRLVLDGYASLQRDAQRPQAKRQKKRAGASTAPEPQQPPNEIAHP
ncbi:MAG: sulfatase [Verrucomicrobiae bacterium]|nr:sulfatase [Verrucomicrobiae bacterium]